MNQALQRTQEINDDSEDSLQEIINALQDINDIIQDLHNDLRELDSKLIGTFDNTEKPVRRVLENSRDLIKNLHHMDRVSITITLESLNHAIEIYGDSNICDTPEHIALTDNRDNVVHTVYIKGGRPGTVTVNPKYIGLKTFGGFVIVSIPILLLGYTVYRFCRIK